MTQNIRIKICCISSPEEAKLASTVGADFLGLVGPMPSGPGILDHRAAREITDGHSGNGKPILLTSSTTATEIAVDARRVAVDHVQVVRHIDRIEAKKLSALPLAYFQVIHVEDENALGLIETYGDYCDAFLLDSGKPSRNTLGGTGETHDWNISAEFVRRASKPTFLAGGLTPDNVTDAIRQVRPDGIDICSGVRNSGALDAALLTAFVSAAKAAG